MAMKGYSMLQGRSLTIKCSLVLYQAYLLGRESYQFAGVPLIYSTASADRVKSSFNNLYD